MKGSDALEMAKTKEISRLSKKMPYWEAHRCVSIMISEGIKAFYEGEVEPLTHDEIMNGVFIGKAKG